MVDQKKPFGFNYILEKALEPIFISGIVFATGKKDAIMMDVVFRLNNENIVLVQRYMTTPADFKRMALGMKEALESFEKIHGAIDVDAKRIITPGAGEEFKQ